MTHLQALFISQDWHIKNGPNMALNLNLLVATLLPNQVS